MDKPKDYRDVFLRLRQRAEDALRGKQVDLNGLPVEDIQALLHELQVHQIELTLQNEELRRVQVELEEARDRYSDLYDFAPVGYCTLDQKDHILETNQAMANLLEQDRAELIHTKLSDYIDREDQDRYYLHRQQIYQSGSRQWTELRMVNRSGERRVVHLECVLDHEDNTRIRAAISDITGRKQVEKELQEYARDLERANLALNDFNLIASHDLQEPLRKIQAFGHLLGSRYGEVLGDEGNDYLTRITSAAERMATLLHALLALSRVTSKGLPFVEVDLNQIAAGVLSDLEVLLAESNGKIEIRELATIQADPVQMQELLQNLLTNSIKHCSPEVPPFIIVSNHVQDHTVNITVEDNGIGIDMQFARHIFEPFTRLSGRTSSSGSGIGLAICKKIVERHGGSIQVDSLPGSGSKFTVSLPISH